MRLNGKKELTPVHYGDSAVKILDKRKVDFGTHWHERMELILIHEGSLMLTAAGRSFEVKAGEVAVLSPEMPHSGDAGEDGLLYSTLMFDLSAFHNLTAASEKYLQPVSAGRTLFHPVTDDREIAGLMREILSEQGDGPAALRVVGRIYELTALLYERCLAEEEHAEVRDQRFREVLDYVNRNFCEEISTAELSRRFGYDEAYFCRRFKAVTGLTPMRYIRLLRLEQARRLLRREDRPVGEIAAACGFSDGGHFARCFRQHFGMTPTGYQKKRP